MSKHILIVDDCRTTRKLLIYSLKDTHYQITVASNGIDALEKMASCPVDLVITDLNMPKMDGLELVRALRGETLYNHIPIIMLTTEGKEEEKKKGLASGANRYLVKPVSREVLHNQIKELLRGK